MKCPIAIFAYRRPEHLRRVVESLKANPEATVTDVFLYSDGPKKPSDQTHVDAVRKYLHTISGFKSTTIIERKTNYGLSGSIIDGVTEICNIYGRVAIVEDDVEVSPFFISWINDALDKYECDDRVISVGCYVFPIEANLPDTFFLNIPDCWGWAVWKRSWDLFEPDGVKLLKELKNRRLDQHFDFQGSYPYMDMLRAQIVGDNDSWAIRWYATAVLTGGLTIYPGLSMSVNIGFDGSGTHCGVDKTYELTLARRKIRLNNIPVEESLYARKTWSMFFGNQSPSKKKFSLLSRFRQMLKPF